MALYTQDFVERVRAANDIVQVVESYNVQLKRAGSNMLGLCPFHNEKTPSFNVRPAEQYFRCFGCGAKGDIFRFVQMAERVEFPEAVKLLAERAGLALEFETPAKAKEAQKQGQTKSALLWCCSRALDYFEQALVSENGKNAQEYLLSRGFTRETISQWRLGWSPDSWDGLSAFLLKSAKESPAKEKVMEYAVLAGVLRTRESDNGKKRYYDAFRGRVMFPILDSQWRPIGFGGRLLEEKPEAGGKYINSSEGRLFEKRRILFGLPHAAKDISLTGSVIVVEGYTDVIMCHQYGIRNVVATLGTALTEDHVALLRRYVQGKGRVIAFFDADDAGEKATARAIALFMRQDVPLSVVRNLELKDAAEFLPRFGADEFKRRLALAEDSFSHLLNDTLGKAKGKDVMSVGLAVKSVMETVNLCPDPVKLALMRRRVAAEAGVPEETLPVPAPDKARTMVPRAGAAPQAARPAGKRGLSMPAAGADLEDALKRNGEAQKRREVRLLRFMWESRDWCAHIADAYPPDEWRDPAAAEVAGLVRDAWENGQAPSVNAVRPRVEHPGSVEILADLVFQDEEPLTEKELSGLLALVLDLEQREKAGQLLSQLDEAEKAGDEELQVMLLVEYRKLQVMRKKR